MKTTRKYNRSEIMKEAHERYSWQKRNGVSFGECLKQSWDDAKWQVITMEKLARQDAEFKAREDARWAQIRAESAKKNAEIDRKLKAQGIDLHTYTMTNYYHNTSCGTYFGD